MALLNRSDFDWSTTVRLRSSYMPNTHVNIWASIPGIIVSGTILYVSLTTKNLKGQFKIPVISLSSCSLFAACASLIFHIWYLLMLRMNVEVNFTLCSVLRRLYDHGQTPRIFCNLIIALDRHLTVIYNMKYCRKFILILILASLTFAATVTLASLLWGIVKEEDVCGPTLNGPSYFSNIVLGSWCTVTTVAFALNIRLMFFIFKHQQRNKTSERHRTAREQKNERWMSVGITVQSFLPLIPFAMIVYGLFSYFNYSGATLPQWYWLLSLALGYSNNTTIPLITALSIGPFRTALRIKFFPNCNSAVTVLRSQISSNSARPTSSRSVVA